MDKDVHYTRSFTLLYTQRLALLDKGVLYNHRLTSLDKGDPLPQNQS